MGTFAKYDPVELDIIKCWQESKNEYEAFEEFAEAGLCDEDLEVLVLHRGVDCGHGDPLIERYLAHVNTARLRQNTPETQEDNHG